MTVSIINRYNMKIMLSHFMKTAQLPPHCLIYYFPDFYHLFKVPYSINKQIYHLSLAYLVVFMLKISVFQVNHDAYLKYSFKHSSSHLGSLYLSFSSRTYGRSSRLIMFINLKPEATFTGQHKSSGCFLL